MAMHNLRSHFGLDEHPFAINVDVHQGKLLGFDTHSYLFGHWMARWLGVGWPEGQKHPAPRVKEPEMQRRNRYR